MVKLNKSQAFEPSRSKSERRGAADGIMAVDPGITALRGVALPHCTTASGTLPTSFGET